jgi:hypothetical protein
MIEHLFMSSSYVGYFEDLKCYGSGFQLAKCDFFSFSFSLDPSYFQIITISFVTTHDYLLFATIIGYISSTIFSIWFYL